jgi:hypothetical protein
MTLVSYRKLIYFSFTLKLQRLFMSPNIVVHVTWHHSHNIMHGVMVQPFDHEAWKKFKRIHTQFSIELRSIQISLCTHGFNPFRSFSEPYSCWSVLLMVYNLPPMMCIRLELVFLSTFILDLNSQSRNIDVCLR